MTEVLIWHNTPLSVEFFPDKAIGHVTITDGHPLLDGHFDGLPILPGVGQVELAETILAQWEQREIDTVEVRRSKFLARISPGTSLVMCVEPTKMSAANGLKAWDWTLTTQEGVVCSKGTFLETGIEP